MAAFTVVTDSSGHVGLDLVSSNNQTAEVATEFDEAAVPLSLSEKYPTGVVVGRVLSTTILTLGFPGNFLSALIWLRLTVRDRISSGVYLMSLAISDSVFLVAYLMQLLYFLWELRFLSCPHTFGIVFVALMSSHYLSLLLVLAFNVHRFLAITWPLKVSFLVIHDKSAQTNLGRGPRRGTVAYARHKVPIGYNGAPQIRPKSTPSRRPIPKPHYLPHPWSRPTYDVRSAVFPQCSGQTDRPTDRSSTGKLDDYRPLRSESDAA